MILLGGPYIGSFEHEVLTFRPHMLWVMAKSKPDNFYVNSHGNRLFLYDFVDMENRYPVYEHISRDEKSQIGYIHKNVDNKVYQTMVKNFKARVCENEECNKRDMEIHNLNYVRSTPHYSIYKKIFSPIPVPDIENPYKDKIIFIPHSTEKREFLSHVKRHLKQYDDIIIAGDNHCRFKKANVVLNMIDYYENGLKTMIKMISEAKAVVCPISFWTTICNLQQAPVFSWGKNVGQHRENGIYYFGNKKCTVLSSDNETVVIRMIDNFLEEVYHGRI